MGIEIKLGPFEIFVSDKTIDNTLCFLLCVVVAAATLTGLVLLT